MSGNKKLHSPRVSGAAWRVTKMKAKKDRGGNLLHGRDLGTPQQHPLQKARARSGQGHCQHPNPCAGAPLGSPAPINHPVPVLCCSPGVPSAHTPPCPPAPVHPCSPWHPCTTPLPCSAAPHGPQHCGPMALSHPQSDAACSELARLQDKAEPSQLGSPTAWQHAGCTGDGSPAPVRHHGPQHC